MPNLILLFNHTLTEIQRRDAYDGLGVEDIIAPPEPIKKIWAQVPPDIDSLDEYLAPVFTWLAQAGKDGDFVLIQGEFGAAWLAVDRAFALGLIPVYSTTRRRATEEHLASGEVKIRHLFAHVRFRRYGE